MEPKTATQQESGKTNTPAHTSGNNPGGGQTATSSGGGQTATSFGQKVQNVREEVENRGGEFIDQTKQAVTDAYDKTSRSLSENYQKAVDFGRDNPGTATLIAFGAGIGIGLLLANNYSSRSRASRVVPPVMDALTNLAYDIFRR